MAYDLTAFQAKTQASIAALPAAPDPKFLLILGKAVEATTPAVAVSDVVAAAATGVSNVNGAATGALAQITTAQATATGAVGSAQTSAVSAVNTARDQAVQAVRDQQAQGGGSTTAANVSYTPAGSLTATNVQAALGQLDGLKLAKASNLGDLPDPKAARRNLGLDKLTGNGDAAYTIQPGDRTVAVTAPLTAPRTLTLPAASAMNPGASLRIIDLVGGISATNTLTVAAAGSDTINGAASFTFAAPYTDFQVTTDGAGKWVFDVQGLARGGTGATTAAGARTNLGLKGAALLDAAVAGGVATLDPTTGKLVSGQIPDALLGAVRYQGGWNASTNSPALPAPAAANKGWYYIVTTAGTTGQPGPSGTIAEWAVGDWIVSDGVYWEKVDSSDQVTSVAGLMGAITAAALTGALNAFLPDTGSAAGTKGMVPAPPAGAAAAGRYLRADGTWAALAYATAADVWAGTDTGKIVTAKALRDAQVPQALTDATTVAWDATTGFNAKVTIAGNRTLGVIANPVEGLTYKLRVKQDATGGRTLSYPNANYDFGAAGAPSLSTGANLVDILAFDCIDAATPVFAFTGIGKGY